MLGFLGGASIGAGEVLPRRRFCVETRRAPSLLSVAPPLKFPRYRAPKGADSLIGVLGEVLPYPHLGSLEA